MGRRGMSMVPSHAFGPYMPLVVKCWCTGSFNLSSTTNLQLQFEGSYHFIHFVSVSRSNFLSIWPSQSRSGRSYPFLIFSNSSHLSHTLLIQPNMSFSRWDSELCADLISIDLKIRINHKKNKPNKYIHISETHQNTKAIIFQKMNSYSESA